MRQNSVRKVVSDRRNGPLRQRFIRRSPLGHLINEKLEPALAEKLSSSPLTFGYGVCSGQPIEDELAEGFQTKGEIAFYCVLALLDPLKALYQNIVSCRRSVGIKIGPQRVFHDGRFRYAGRKNHFFELAVHLMGKADVDAWLHGSEFRKEVAVCPVHAKDALGGF